MRRGYVCVYCVCVCVQYIPHDLSSSNQVLSVRKGGVFPGRQFNVDEEDEDDGDDTSVLERKIHAANMPEAALRVCLKELKRWAFSFSPEY